MTNTSGLYNLDKNGKPVPAKSLEQWARQYEEGAGKRIVRQDYVGKTLVSTVFLAIDHSFGSGPPVLWETMVFPAGIDMEDCCKRYTSKADAVAGHARILAEVQSLAKKQRGLKS